MVELIILASRLIAKFIKTFHLGSGGTWPGEIALLLDPKILSKLIPENAKVIVVAGTNGKTTTSKIIRTILETNKLGSIVHNETGANLLNGIVASLLTTADRKASFVVMETDEATLPQVLGQITPDIVILLDLFRDQLDRYGEVDTIAKKWLVALKKSPAGKTKLVINADDPQLAWIGKNVPQQIKYFGLGNKKYFLPAVQHATDSIYCPNCGARLKFSGTYISHLGQYSCPYCQFSHPKNEVRSGTYPVSLPGRYNEYNFLAAGLASELLGLSRQKVSQGLHSFTPAFGRSETISFQSRKVRILLSKNPAGFNESLRTALEQKAKNLLLVLNDRVPDGRDVSWIWDVDFEEMAKIGANISVSGDRVFDLALRLKYADLSQKLPDSIPDLKSAVFESISNTKTSETLWILPTYSAMLDIRKILTGKKIL